MTPSEKRRRKLLQQTRNLYSDRRTPPAIHPRYGNLYADLYDEDVSTGGTLGIRITICLLLFACFITMDYTENTMLNMNSEQVETMVAENLQIDDIVNFVDITY